jgi:hypothetical protein
MLFRPFLTSLSSITPARPRKSPSLLNIVRSDFAFYATRQRKTASRMSQGSSGTLERHWFGSDLRKWRNAYGIMEIGKTVEGEICRSNSHSQNQLKVAFQYEDDVRSAGKCGRDHYMNELSSCCASNQVRKMPWRGNTCLAPCLLARFSTMSFECITVIP